MNQTNKSRMQILIFIYSLGDGGAERVTANLANYWAEKDWEIIIVTIAPITWDLFELHPEINRISLEMAKESPNALVGLWQNISRVIALRKVLKQIKPDIALAMMSTANVILALASWGLIFTKTVSSERTHPPRRPLGYVWETLRRYTYGLLDASTAMSNEGKDWIENNTKAKRVLAIANPVTWPLPLLEPQIIPPQSQRRRLIGVGRLVDVKGFDALIDAFSKLSNKHWKWDLVIIGEGPLRPSLEKLIQQLDLQNRIILPGRVGNIGEWYETANIYVLTSHFEGFPNTLIEAMAYGLAAISFNCDTGPRDIIHHGVDGLLVTPGDLGELTMALDRLMSNDLLRKQFSERALEVRERFSMVRIAGMWEKLFEELLNGQK